MKVLKNIYRVARSLLFSVIIFIAAVYLILYILLSVPGVQNQIRLLAMKEASAFLGGEVEIQNLAIRPFNEVIISGLEVRTPKGEKCLGVETLGAGISLIKLLRGEGIEFSYGEIIGLDARIWQTAPDSTLNIQFIIDAFQPKDKNKPPAKFNLNLRNVVLRRCAVSFDKKWIPAEGVFDKIDFNHLRLTDLKADIAFPQIKNDDFIIDLRRLSFEEAGGLKLEKLAFKSHITTSKITLSDLIIELPFSKIVPSDFSLEFDGFSDIPQALSQGKHSLSFVNNQISLSDLSCFLPALRRYPQAFTFNADLEGNTSNLRVNRLNLSSREDFLLSLSGEIEGMEKSEETEFSADDLRIKLSHYSLSELKGWIPGLSTEADNILSNLGSIDLSATGQGAVNSGNYELDCRLTSDCGDIFIIGKSLGLKKGKGTFSAEVSTEKFDVYRLLGKGKIGDIETVITASGELRGKDIDGEADCYIPKIEFGGQMLGGISASVVKAGNNIVGSVKSDNPTAQLNTECELNLDGINSNLHISGEIQSFNPYLLGLTDKYEGYTAKGGFKADLYGNSIDNVTGEVTLANLAFGASGKKSIYLDNLDIKSECTDDNRQISLNSDWVDGEITGNFKMAELPAELIGMASAVFPSLVMPPKKGIGELQSDMEFSLLVKADNSLTDFFNLPVRLLVPIAIDGSVNGTHNMASLEIDVPYLQQGKNKLLRDNRIKLDIDGIKKNMNLDVASTFPVKRGELSLNFNLMGQEDKVYSDIDWINTENSNFKGSLSIDADLRKNELSSKPEVLLNINPSIFTMGSAKWNIDKSSVSYADNIINIDGIKIWHDDQFVEIDGIASALLTDSLSVKLAAIDLDYVFETLNINYVTFGGEATGDITAKGALGKEPVALTDNLSVKNLTYNGALLGDAAIKSKWDNVEKEVTIFADIKKDGHRKALVDGGIWVTRDSLSFAIDADRVPVGFLGSFMAAFTSDVSGYASGKAKLFGSFSDIDLIGRIYGDSIAIKLDYTNTYYHGSDSVYLDPGRITIPGFTLYDREGNSALLTGELTHRYFHDPSFNFKISDAKGLLCYDTNHLMNPDWYGTIYGDGGAVVRGWPGTVSVSVDMSIADKSTFTFVLNDTQAAADYNFLTFSDRRKEEYEKHSTDSVPDIIAAFKKKINEEDGDPTRFMMDIRCSVTPTALMTLVMDPIAGDKITARGNGAIQIDYESDSDDFQMLGKYTLVEGNYNFSLQDLILRNFNILPGSSISFNGDPLNANLDITASYRVNTNLSDLDKSFSTDPELARTNVPVDALLMVKGEMQQPEITFDITLPTLTQDVERKVKSIISTDDMMSRQIIYLLALNRFYTPEYMGSSSNGSELAAVASTTLSSQLSNMLGQLTDKFTLAPSFRSDKGDFSDLEVDVALSSRLLNNRLLVNGNFGYRDKNTSNTTFVGDFDIEYLLSRNGNLRLKAYNHFNDQNYYLREALTTQGLGIVFRKEFDNPFSIFKKKKKETGLTEVPEEVKDSTTNH